MSLQEILHSSEKLFDVLLSEHFSDLKCYLPIAEKLAIPVITTMPIHNHFLADRDMGLINNPAVVPMQYFSYSVEMSFAERIRNLWNTLLFDYLCTPIRQNLNDEILRKEFSEELLHKKKVSLIFNNNHASLLPRPSVPNAIDVGGIHIGPPRPLPTVSL